METLIVEKNRPILNLKTSKEACRIGLRHSVGMIGFKEPWPLKNSLLQCCEVF